MSLLCMYHTFIRNCAFVVVERASCCGSINVVIKKLHSGGGLGVENIFINEATILFKIMHENIVTLIAVL